MDQSLLVLLHGLPTSAKWHTLQYVGRHPVAQVIHTHLIAPGIDYETLFWLLSKKAMYKKLIRLATDESFGHLKHPMLKPLILEYKAITRQYSVIFFGTSDGWFPDCVKMWRLIQNNL